MPFCLRRCSFCCFYSRATSRAASLADFLSTLRQEFSFFAPAFAGDEFQALYIGGGTPSLLTAEQIKRLLSEFFERYQVNGEGSRTFECDPIGVTREKLAALRSFGFNRIGMGVQSLSDKVLALENRGHQSLPVVERAMRLVREVGGFELNLDLLLGLRGDDEETFLKSFESVMLWEPDAVAVYLVWPPGPYLKEFYSGDLRSFRESIAARYGGVIGRIRSLIKGRYRWTDRRPALTDDAWYFARLRRLAGHKPFYKHTYYDFTAEPSSVFGLGPTARSRVAGVSAYENVSAHNAAFDPARAIYRGRRLSAHDEMVKYAVLNVCAGNDISSSEFQRFFGVSVERAFPGAVGELLRDGFMASKDGGYRFVTRSGEELTRCAARFAADAQGGGRRMPENAGLPNTAEMPKNKPDAPRGCWRLRVEPLRAGVGYVSRTAALGLALEEQGAAATTSKSPDPLLVRIASRIFLRAAEGRGGSSAHEVESFVSAKLAEISLKIGASVISEKTVRRGEAA
ncbi:MAG: radical SAM protein [Elusimicrobia bacterium]|nr:radical SAM protein [Elusimicrobiota bacterium]